MDIGCLCMKITDSCICYRQQQHRNSHSLVTALVIEVTFYSNALKFNFHSYKPDEIAGLLSILISAQKSNLMDYGYINKLYNIRKQVIFHFGKYIQGNRLVTNLHSAYATMITQLIGHWNISYWQELLSRDKMHIFTDVSKFIKEYINQQHWPCEAVCS